MTHPYGHYPQERSYLADANQEITARRAEIEQQNAELDTEPSLADEGHRFRFTMISAGSYAVTGEPGHTDSELWSAPWTLEVRGWSLREALVKASALPPASWTQPAWETETTLSGNAPETRSD